MPPVEDLSGFLRDWGVPCIAGTQQFLGMLDQPDETLDLPNARVHSRQYDLTFITAEADLSEGAAVTVNGQAFKVREAPRQVDDGAFSRVLLSKV